MRFTYNGVFMIAASAVPMLETAMRGKLAALQAQGEAEAAKRGGLPIRKDGSVAIITVRGVMMKFGDPYWGEASTSDAAEAVRAATMDEDVGSIVLELDSPGGSVDGLAEFTDAVAAAGAVKPVVSQVSGMAASAAYMVASATSRIIAHRMDLVGSIGTRMLLFDTSKWYEEKGIKAIPVDTGEFKSAGAPGVPITDAQIADFQRVVDAYFADFKAVVTKGRRSKMSPEQVTQAADGRVFTAGEALQMGLVDEIATTAQTVARLKANALPPARLTMLRSKVAAAAAACTLT